MNVITVKFDTSQWESALRKLQARAVPAQVRALNRSASTARTGMTRLIAADMKLKAVTVREKIEIQEARPYKLSAVLNASLRRIPIYDFSAKGPYPSRGKGRGVTARTATRRYPHAFIAQMRSGHSGVFQRRGPSRLPIFELLGASIGEVFGKYHEEGVRIANEALAKNLQSEFRFALLEVAQKG